MSGGGGCRLTDCLQNALISLFCKKSLIYVGRSAEKGASGEVFFDGSDNFVVLQVGKRGSGKSYGMGSLLEGFATKNDSGIGRHKERRAVLLLDPLDIHWPALLPISPEGPDGLRKQFEVFRKWPNLGIEPINARAWIRLAFD
jgi:hypothetical protein